MRKLKSSRPSRVVGPALVCAAPGNADNDVINIRAAIEIAVTARFNKETTNAQGRHTLAPVTTDERYTGSLNCTGVTLKNISFHFVQLLVVKGILRARGASKARANRRCPFMNFGVARVRLRVWILMVRSRRGTLDK